MNKKEKCIFDADEQALILIVDDVPKNLQVLGAVLYQEGYEIAMADNGLIALETIEENLPDLILLDIMMPEMDGFEVCRKIKADDRFKDIPIIFLSAKNETDSLVKGFKEGAVDYITKPFNSEELIARVKTHIDLKRSKERIGIYNTELKKLVKIKSEFLGMAAHDMKNPLNSIIGFSHLIKSDFDTKDVSTINISSVKKYIDNIIDTSNFMFNTVNEMLNLEILDQGNIKLNKTKACVGRILDTVLVNLKMQADAKNIKLYRNRFQVCQAEVDEDKLREIIQNLISNAIKYSPHNKNVWVSLSTFCEDKERFLQISFKDEGPGFSQDDLKSIFKKFAKLSAMPTGGETSSGLGLSIVKKLVEMHGGSVCLNSNYTDGAEFIVKLPTGVLVDTIEPFEVDEKYYEFGSIDDNVVKNSLNVNCYLEQISNLNENQIQKINHYIDTQFLKQWESVSKTNMINDIREFGVTLRDYGRDNNFKIFERYGEDLNIQALQFDIEKLPRLLKLFPEIIKQLKSNNMLKK